MFTARLCVWNALFEIVLSYFNDANFLFIVPTHPITHSVNTDNQREISKPFAEKLDGQRRMAKSSEKSVGLERLNSSMM